MSVLGAVRPVFRAVGQTVVPEAARLTEPEWAAVETIVERTLATRPPKLQRQLVTLVHLLQWLPLLRYGQPFTALDPDRRTRFLATMQDAPLILLRRGFWGLRTLVLMGYYARPEAATEIGYRAHPRGWEARRP